MDSRYELSGDFDVDVLDASHDRPVLVDFWAEWCGPCRVLGPTLESMAEAADDRWRLVKIDTERHRDLALRFGIRSIPAVKLFHRGALLDEFVGALPEAQIRVWLDEALARAGAGGDAADDPLAEARELLLDDPRAAVARAAEAPDDRDEDLRAAIQTLGRLFDLVQRDALDELGKPSPARERYASAAHAFLEGRIDEALESWIELLARDRVLDEDGARRAIVATFHWLGEDDPVTQEYRRRFSAALF